MKEITVHTEKQLKMDFDAFLRSFKQNKDSSFAFLLGAGASITSGVQSAEDCIWDWKKLIYLSNNPTYESFLDIHADYCRKRIQAWIDEQGGYPKEKSEEEYVFYAENTFPFPGDRTKYFKDLCSNKSPNIGYKLLCLLHKYGVLKSVWTTNFDGLVERAAHQANITPINVNLDNPDRIYQSENTYDLLYIALHGDYKYSALKNTAEELDSQQDTFSNRLKEYFVDRHLIVIGYSGRDQSLMKSLTEAFSRPGAGRLYWCGYGTYMNDNVKSLLTTARNAGRDAVFVETDGFDKTIISLVISAFNDDVEKSKEIYQILEDMNADFPITPFELSAVNMGGCIKTNLYPIVVPHDIFVFEIAFPNNESQWHFLKNRIKGKDIIAVPYNGKIFAFGYSEQIHLAFSDCLKGEISRLPLSINELKENPTLKMVVIKTLICGISSCCGKQAVVSKRLICDRAFPFGKYKGVYEAIKIDMIFLDDKDYALMSVVPTLYFEDENITYEQRKNLMSEYLDNKRNTQYDDIISRWEQTLFNGENRIFDYPLNSGYNFKYKISKNRGLVAVDYTEKGVIPQTQFTDEKIIYSGIYIPEPKLDFWNKISKTVIRDPNPMRGLLQNSPYDYEFHTNFKTNVKLGIICPNSYTLQFKDFLNGLNGSVPVSSTDYVQPYIGFEQIYSSSLDIPATNSNLWIKCNDIQHDSIKLAQNICKFAHKLANNNPDIIIVIFIPKIWEQHRSFKKDGETFDLHNYIKAYASQNGFTTQFVEEKTIFNTRMKNQIYWWLSLALFVKSMRTPWALSDLDADTAYAGIGYSVKKEANGKTNIVVGCSHIYNSKGQGLRYKLSKIDNPIIDRKNNPYLSYEEAYKLGINVQELFVKSMDRMPQRVVIHKRTPFKKDEIKGITDALSHAGIKNVDLVTIRMEDSIKCIDQYLQYGHPINAHFPVMRGICFAVSQYECLLWTHGTIDSVKPNRSYFPGGRGIPSPLRIIKYHGNGSMQTIAREILGFTKMNWNSFNFYTKFPATIDTSNTLAQVGNLLAHYDGRTYDYRYFI